MNLTYEERRALATMRNAIKRKPEIINELMKDLAYEGAHAVLVQLKTEMGQVMAVNRAFMEAAAALAKQQKDNTP
jgi:hypothetical protein